MSENILFVDDEIQILKSLKRAFLFCDYNIFTAQSGNEALDILSKENIDLMITDIRMPEMNGYELLKKAKEFFPSTIRVVLSGYADEATLIKIKQDSLSTLYIPKPWHNDELITSIKQIFNIENILKQKNLLEVINEIKILPSPNNIYNRFNSLMQKDADIKEFSELVESDPSISAKILQVINSDFYGVRTGSVKKAIIYLGLNNIKNIILSLSIYNRDFKNKYLKRDIEILWQHSVMTNKILSFLYKRLLNEKIPEICEIAGLLHDVGKFVLISNFAEEYLRVTKDIRDTDDICDFIENVEFMNISHGEIGAYFLNWWDLPQPIVESTLYHHNPLDEKIINKELLSLLYIADIFSWNILSNVYVKTIDPKVLEVFNLTKESCNNLLNEIKIFIY